MKKIGLVTGGGDCPGLNTVIDSLVKSLDSEYEILGFFRGFEGVLGNDFKLLDRHYTNQSRFDGGTILKSTNKGNFASKTKNGEIQQIDLEILKKSKAVYDNHRLDCLVVLGGDGTMAAASQLQEQGVNIIGIPKSIDNDLYGTELTFGFQTAVEIATEALDRLETTAKSHDRTMILEVMGRNAGWIGLYSGIAGGANIILIPEIPFDIKAIYEVIEKRKEVGKGNTLIVVSEGCFPSHGHKRYSSAGGESSEILLGGIGEFIAKQLNDRDIDSRATRLGHIQRGGTPVSMDRILSIQMGSYAATLVKQEKYGFMIGYNGGSLSEQPLIECISQMKLVNPESKIIELTKQMGVSFGV
jgi:6-phosphofructokinase 1